MEKSISGYSYGRAAKSPISLTDFALLQQTVLFTDTDVRALRMAGEILQDYTEEILDVWYGFVGANEHLLYYFTQNGAPVGDYLDGVRKRFAQWIDDLCSRPFDQEWLDYQHEIGLRHHSSKKNRTDKIEAVPIIHYRYMVAFIYPITATIKPFLTRKGHSEEVVNQMHQAWFKAVTLSVILWTQPYIKSGEF